VVRRLLARECELCGQAANTQAHQVRKLSDLDQQGQEQPAWAALMAKMRRKTLMVCPGLPRRHPPGKATAGHGITREPDAVKIARPVRGEAAGKRTSHSGWHLARRPTHDAGFIAADATFRGVR